MTVSVLKIAELAHQINTIYSRYIGEIKNDWWEIPTKARLRVVRAVTTALKNPPTNPEQYHKAWEKDLKSEGWTWGSALSYDKKTHPNLIPYSELPESQKTKDLIFSTIVNTFRFEDLDLNIEALEHDDPHEPGNVD